MCEGPCSPVPRPLQPLRHSWLLPLTLAEQLQAPPLLANLQAQHLLQHLLPLGLLCQPHPLQLLRVQPQQCPAWGVKLRSATDGHQEPRQRKRSVERGTDSKTGRGRQRERWRRRQTQINSETRKEEETRMDRDREEKSQMKTDRQTGRHGERFCRHRPDGEAESGENRKERVARENTGSPRIPVPLHPSGPRHR